MSETISSKPNAGAAFDPTRPAWSNGKPVAKLHWNLKLDAYYGEIDGGPWLWHDRDGRRGDPRYSLTNVPPPSTPESTTDAGQVKGDAAFVERMDRTLRPDWHPSEVYRLIALARRGASLPASSAPHEVPDMAISILLSDFHTSSCYPMATEHEIEAAVARVKKLFANSAPQVDAREGTEPGLFVRLHIESMTREWFAGPNPSVDGYLEVLKRRLARTTPMPEPDLNTDGAQIAAWQRRMAARGGGATPAGTEARR